MGGGEERAGQTPIIPVSDQSDANPRIIGLMDGEVKGGQYERS